MSGFRRLAALFFVHWPTALLAFAAMGIAALGTASMAAMVGSLFDLLAQAGGAASAGSSPVPEALRGGEAAIRAAMAAWLPKPTLVIPVLLAIVLLIKNVAQYTAELLVNRIGLMVVRDLRQDLHENLLGRSVRFFGEHATGELSSVVMADVQRIQTSVGKRVADLLQDSLVVVALLGYIVALHGRLALATLILGPPVILPVLRLARRLRKTAHRSQEEVAKLTDLLQEAIRGHRIVKAFGMEGSEATRFRARNESYFSILMKEARIQARSTPLMEVVAGIGMVVIFVFAEREIAAGRASLGAFLSFTTSVALLYQPLKRLNKGNLDLQQALASAARVFALLDQVDDVRDAPDARALAGFSTSIRFRDVGFAYRSDRAVLQGIDLEIRRGEVVAFVGGSGAGKSTLVQLVPRFFDPTTGSVEIDGIDVRHLTQASLRRQIGLVTQDVFLFNDTVRTNICAGAEDVPMARIEAAAHAAHAAEFIAALPEGYATVVGENGGRLSGGQKQRLAIARALLKDPPILILDEATSALDVESEGIVQAALENLMRDRTTLVIAHRLSTIRRADRIVVLEGGRIVEIGRHDELLAADGAYARYQRLSGMEGERHEKD